MSVIGWEGPKFFYWNIFLFSLQLRKQQNNSNNPNTKLVVQFLLTILFRREGEILPAISLSAGYVLCPVIVVDGVNY